MVALQHPGSGIVLAYYPHASREGLEKSPQDAGMFLLCSARLTHNAAVSSSRLNVADSQCGMDALLPGSVAVQGVCVRLA
jgi:hypothetical protein